jgi:hypothetical protein
MLKRADWQALQEAQKRASKPVQLAFSFDEQVHQIQNDGNKRARHNGRPQWRTALASSAARHGKN